MIEFNLALNGGNDKPYATVNITGDDFTLAEQVLGDSTHVQAILDENNILHIKPADCKGWRLKKSLNTKADDRYHFQICTPSNSNIQAPDFTDANKYPFRNLTQYINLTENELQIVLPEDDKIKFIDLKNDGKSSRYIDKIGSIKGRVRSWKPIVTLEKAKQFIADTSKISDISLSYAIFDDLEKLTYLQQCFAIRAKNAKIPEFERNIQFYSIPVNPETIKRRNELNNIYLNEWQFVKHRETGEVFMVHGVNYLAFIANDTNETGCSYYNDYTYGYKKIGIRWIITVMGVTKTRKGKFKPSNLYSYRIEDLLPATYLEAYKYFKANETRRPIGKNIEGINFK